MIADDLQQFRSLLVNGRPAIAVDYGKVKLGVAVSTPNYSIAMPIGIIAVKTEEEKIKAILNLVDKYSVSGVVIGLPITMQGQINVQAEMVKKFALLLSAAIGDLPIYLQDERFTTAAANSLLKSIGLNRKQRNQQDDSVAASMILETVLEAMKHVARVI